MRKILLPLLISTITVSMPVLAKEKDLTEVDEEGRVKITWQSPQDYHDIRPSQQTRTSFRKQVFKELDEAFEELASELPEGQVLELTVTDIDLAGQVWPASFIGFRNGTNDIRLIKRIHIPRMEFAYSLKDDGGNEIKADTVQVKDMNYLDRLSVRFSERPFAYEKRMIRDWFDDTFAEEVVKL